MTTSLKGFGSNIGVQGLRYVSAQLFGGQGLGG